MVRAHRIWRQDEDAQGTFGGLASERAVRTRLQTLAVTLAEQAPAAHAALGLSAEHWRAGAPSRLLDRTADAVRAWSGLTGAGRAPAEALILTQLLAGRLGGWGSGGLDGATGRRLRRAAANIDAARLGDDAMAAGHACFERSDYRSAAACFFRAAGEAHAPVAMLRAALALNHAGDVTGALWLVRATLLEAPERFGAGDARARAQLLLRRLAERAEARAAVPPTPTESYAIATIGRPSATGAERPTETARPQSPGPVTGRDADLGSEVVAAEPVASAEVWAARLLATESSALEARTEEVASGTVSEDAALAWSVEPPDRSMAPTEWTAFEALPR